MHSVFLTKAALKDLAGFPADIQIQLRDCIRSLAANPFPPGVKKLKSGSGGYRIRSGDYRILYTVAGQDVTVYAAGNRKDIYR